MAELDVEALKRRLSDVASQGTWTTLNDHEAFAFIAVLEDGDRLRAALREMLDAHVEAFISDPKTLDDWLDNGPKNQRWLLTELDEAILNAVIALGHEWAERAREILAENERWRPLIRAAQEGRDG